MKAPATPRLASILVQRGGGPCTSMVLSIQAVLDAYARRVPLHEIAAVTANAFMVTYAANARPEDRWNMYARHAFVVEAARSYGIQLRALHPPSAAPLPVPPPEYGLHFRDSYVPLIEAALARDEPVLAWMGWPAPQTAIWGVVTGVDPISKRCFGRTMFSKGRDVEMPGPAVQAYVVQECGPQGSAAPDATDRKPEDGAAPDAIGRVPENDAKPGANGSVPNGAAPDAIGRVPDSAAPDSTASDATGRRSDGAKPGANGSVPDGAAPDAIGRVPDSAAPGAIGCVLRRASAVLNDELGPTFGVTSGPAALARWREALLNEEAALDAASLACDVHSGIARMLVAGRRAALKYFASHARCVSAPQRQAIEACAALFGELIARLETFVDEEDLRLDIESEQSRLELADAVASIIPIEERAAEVLRTAIA